MSGFQVNPSRYPSNLLSCPLELEKDMLIINPIHFYSAYYPNVYFLDRSGKEDKQEKKEE
jgi:hypothetical protein